MARAVLRVPHPDGPGHASDLAGAQVSFRQSIVVAGLRCLFVYVAPLFAPFARLTDSLGAPVGLALALVAMSLLVVSARRFWRADHRLRWWYTGVAAVAFAFLAAGAVVDIATLVR